MADDYFTVKGGMQTSFTEKKSEFIGNLSFVRSHEDVLKFMENVKLLHKNAKRYCYAYILRAGNEIRYSDDGEPQGKAGIPILEVLKKNNLSDVCLVVTRYFGGILLGGGGLLRAYSKSASDTVAAAEIVHMVYCKSILLTVSYSDYDKIAFCFSNFNLSVKNTDYSSDIKIQIDILNIEFDKFNEVITEKSSGKAVIRTIGEKFSDLPIKK